MSRIGKQALFIPDGVTLRVIEEEHNTETFKVIVEGEKGCLDTCLPTFLCLRPDEGTPQEPSGHQKIQPGSELTEERSEGGVAISYKQVFSKHDSLVIDVLPKHHLPNRALVKFLTQSRVASLRGMYRTLLGNMITGVSAGFEKELVITGVGYRAVLSEPEQQQSTRHHRDGTSCAPTAVLELYVGYSHPVTIEVPPLITVKVETPTKINIRGISKESVGTFAAKIRSTRPPEPYKGKGIAYVGERIKRKAVKASK